MNEDLDVRTRRSGAGGRGQGAEQAAEAVKGKWLLWPEGVGEGWQVITWPPGPLGPGLASGEMGWLQGFEQRRDVTWTSE